MNQTINEEEAIKQYLLGQLSEEEQTPLEERLLTDDDFFERLNMAEDELIDEYLADRLGPDDRQEFNGHFMIAPERQQKLRFSKALRKYVATGPKIVPGLWTRIISNSYLRLAASIIIVAGIGLGVYRGFFYQSEVDRGLAALQAAYPKDRPVQARLTGWGYRSFSETRGSGSVNFDRVNHDRAEAILRDEFARHPGAESNHALGVFFLANKELEKAIDNLRKAVELEPLNAQYRSDLGAALLEKAKTDKSAGEHEGGQDSLAKAEEELKQSEDQLNKALALSPVLLEALFNRGMLDQEMGRPQQAAQDWNQYLARDSKSPWADEARRKLELLR
jgi:tetratricopeptide (TPR) repeat protein